MSSLVAQDGCDDCTDQVGSAKYVSKFDLLRGYRQVPVTSQAGEIAAFATSSPCCSSPVLSASCLIDCLSSLWMLVM